MVKKFKKFNRDEKVNNWTIIEEYGLKNRSLHYRIKCKCGAELIKNASQIYKNKECYVCSRKRQTAQGGTRRSHGACSNSSDLYKTYQARYYMIKRCQGKTFKDKKDYFDRGIKVCDRWIESFENFLFDMGKRPENTSLDRIDNDKGYFKENCRWVSTKEQNDNKRGCIYYIYKNEKLTIARWAEKWGITRSKATEWLKREGIDWVIENLEQIKKCKTGMKNSDYKKLGLNERKGAGNRIHASSRNTSHPLHTMYKSWDHMKYTTEGMCEEWRNFLKFIEDMGQKPIGKRLLRKIKNQPFSKENCYWG